MVERKKFLLRLPPKLHEELRGWAEDEMRSLNAQIEYLLRQALVRRNKATARKTDAADGVGNDGAGGDSAGGDGVGEGPARGDGA